MAKKNKKEEEKSIVELVFITDRSGSMRKIKQDMEGGLNSIIEEQQKLKDECYITFAEFDNEFKLLYEGIPLQDVKSYSLIPRGNTALFDAIGRTIGIIEQRLSNIKGKRKVIVNIITDGEENSSKEYTREQIFSLINEKRKNDWEFTFLGADQDAIKVATSLGISSGNAVSYTSTGASSRSVTRGLNIALMSARKSGDISANMYDQNAYERVLKEEESKSNTSS